MSSSDHAYYRARVDTERALALMTEREDVAAIHEELARLYQALVDQQPARPTLRLVTDDKMRAQATMVVRNCADDRADGMAEPSGASGTI